MIHLIDKDATLTEIESLKDNVPYFPTIAEKEAYRAGVDGACCKIYSLEVKEVDLKKEICKALINLKSKDSMRDWFTHFFELGLKAQKGKQIMAKIKIVYKPLSKEEQDKFDKSQQEFYEYIKAQKGEKV